MNKAMVVEQMAKITKKDLAEADTMNEEDPLLAIVLGFNVESEDSGSSITSGIIYDVLDRYEKWKVDEIYKIYDI